MQTKYGNWNSRHWHPDVRPRFWYTVEHLATGNKTRAAISCDDRADFEALLESWNATAPKGYTYTAD